MASERLSGDEHELLYAIAQQATALAGGTMNTEAHDERELLAEIELQLRTLVESGSGDGANLQFITGTENPPTAAPADLNKPAQYYNTSTKFYWNWNIGTQTWIPQPKVYRALLSQTGTSAPSAIVTENTVGAIVWSRGAVGQYTATLSSAFPANKTFILMDYGDSNFAGTVRGIRDNDNDLIVITARIYAEAPAEGEIIIFTLENSDDLLSLSPIEISVYP